MGCSPHQRSYLVLYHFSRTANQNETVRHQDGASRVASSGWLTLFMAAKDGVPFSSRKGHSDFRRHRVKTIPIGYPGGPPAIRLPGSRRPFGFVWGEHPIDFSEARTHSMLVLMSKHEMVKAVFGRASRSGFHHFLTSVFHLNHSPEVRFDFLGGVMVVSLSVGVVFLMRLFLVW
jgi:hypothetical protein